MSDEGSGFEDKYNITHRDGEPVPLLVNYFVLRLDTDPHAREAMRVYAGLVEHSDPEFANEILRRLHECEPPFQRQPEEN